MTILNEDLKIKYHRSDNPITITAQEFNDTITNNEEEDIIGVNNDLNDLIRGRLPEGGVMTYVNVLQLEPLALEPDTALYNE